MEIGKINTLRADRFTSVGAFLSDEEGNEVLLPNKYVPLTLEEDDMIDVFISRDSEDRILATTRIPTLLLHQFAYLPIKEVNFYGAFADWGMEKDLMIPFKEQAAKMEEGREYLIVLLHDEATDRLFGSAKVNKYLAPCTDESLLNQEVDVLIGDKTDLGIKVIVNQMYSGLIYHSDILSPVVRGTTIKAYVANIREDGKLDVRLTPSGYQKIEDEADKLWSILVRKREVMLTDKSDPQEIRDTVGMSKKTFKQAVGKLYKQRKIVLESDRIKINPETN